MVPYMASKSLTPLWSIVVALYVYTVCAYSGYMEFRVHFCLTRDFIAIIMHPVHIDGQ